MNKTQQGKTPLIYIALIVVGIVAGGLLVYLLKGSDKINAPAAITTSRTQTTTERKIKYWQAPMNPNYIRNEPGKSPMGMDLIPVYEDDNDGSDVQGLVRIDPVTAQNIGVRTTRAKKLRLFKTITTVGRVAYDEKHVHHVNTKIEGWVNRLFVNFTGQKVNKDDYLLEIYSPKLVTTQEEYLLARDYEKDNTATSGGSSVVELAKRRLEFLDVPAHQIKELEESGKIKKYIHIHSPATGVVVEKTVSEGMFIKPGTTLYTIADLSRVWVYADIYEYELPWIKVGQEAAMVLTAHPGITFKGKVAFIDPFMNPKTRTNKVRLEFDNPDGRLKPDMFANVTLRSRRDKQAIVVPTEAVIMTGKRNIIFVTRGAGKFIPKEVTLGIEAEGYYEIIDGLDSGEEVVTSAQFLIDSESKLKEAISKMLEPETKSSEAGETKKMNHEGMNHENMDMGNEKMNHEGMDKDSEEMDHEGMNHEGMQH
jgi:multidrug efflux pump subunit AcrA (membrane-fusion protein)